MFCAEPDRRRPTTFDFLGGLAFLVCPDTVRIWFLPRSKERFKRRGVEEVRHQTFTSTVMLVSQPKTSTTFMQAV